MTQENRNLTESELETLLKALTDYTDLLREIVDRLENAKLLRQVGISVFASGFIALVIANLYINPWKELQSSQFNIALVVSFISGSACAGGVTYYFSARQRRYTKESERLSAILLKLVRRGSQLRDNGHFSFSQEMYLDLKMADAEASLRHASQAVRANYVSFLRVVAPKKVSYRQEGD